MNKEEAFDWATNRSAYERINQLIELKDNWDGYTGSTFSKELIDKALEILSLIRYYPKYKELYEPFIAPGSDGSILFDWSIPNRQLEIHLEGEGTLSFLKTIGEWEEEGTFPIGELNTLLDWLEELEDEVN